MTASAEAASLRRLAFLLGNPIEHSFSPSIHNAAFKARGIDAEYVAVQVKGGGLYDALQRLRSLEVFGANITLPFKTEALGMMDALTPEAEGTGAVNTVVVKEDGTLIGANTDVEGFLAPLAPHLPAIRGRSVVVAGSGGAARAICYALMKEAKPRRIALIARRPDQAEQVIEDLSQVDTDCILRVKGFETSGRDVRESQLFVNATPVGMAPDIDKTIWPEASDFHERQLVYDLVYTPSETRLLRDARSRGASTLGGMAMLIAQAAGSFKLWTGEEFPAEAAGTSIR